MRTFEHSHQPRRRWDSPATHTEPCWYKKNCTIRFINIQQFCRGERIFIEGYSLSFCPCRVGDVENVLIWRPSASLLW